MLMYEYVSYLGWGLIRNPQVAKKGNFCVLAPLEAISSPPMIPGSVSISWVRRVMIAGLIYHIVISICEINDPNPDQE